MNFQYLKAFGLSLKDRTPFYFFFFNFEMMYCKIYFNAPVFL